MSVGPVCSQLPRSDPLVMDEETEISVLQCGRCSTFLTTTEGSEGHKERCWGVEKDGEYHKMSSEGMSNTMYTVTFDQPNLILERVAVSTEDCLKSTVVPESNRRGRAVGKRKLDPVLNGHQGLGLEEISSPSVPRRSRLKAMMKLQEVIEPDCESDSESEWEQDMSLELEDLEDKPMRKRFKSSSTSNKKSRRAKLRADEVTDIFYTFKCNVCGTKFRTQREFEWHMANIHEDTKGNEVHTCPLCGRMLIKRIVFQSHLKHHENAEAIEDAFDLWNKWPQKQRGKTNAAFWSKCKYCLIPHTSHYSFLTHMKVEHPDKGRYFKFNCPYSCTMEFDCMKLFLMHMRKDHSEEYFGRTIKWGESVNQNYGRPKGKCDICGRMLDVYYLAEHKKRHEIDNKPGIVSINRAPETHPYSCPFPLCQSRSKTVAALKVHFVLHLENNPYTCKFPGCDVKCDAQCHLDRHMKLHTEKPLQCTKCKTYYSRIDKLRNHVCVYDADGSKRNRHSHLRLKRTVDLEFDRQQELLFNDAHENSSSGPNLDAEQDFKSLKPSCTEISEGNESIASEAVVVKEEVQDLLHTSKSEELGSDDEYVVPECNAKEEFDDQNSDDQVKTVKRQVPGGPSKSATSERRNRVSINKIMMTDPAFISVCKENPGFRELMFGTSAKGTVRETWKWSGVAKPKQYKCKDCSTSFRHVNARNKHMEICKLRTNKEANGIEEEEQCEKGENGLKTAVKVGCIICANSFENAAALNRHLENDHKPEEIFKCNECEDIFSNQNSKRRHFQKYHAHRPFKCTECTADFAQKDRLQLHMEKHKTDANFGRAKCPHCEKELVNNTSMKRHMFLIHGLKPVAEVKKIPPKKKTLQKAVKNNSKSTKKTTAARKKKAKPTKRRRKMKVGFSDDDLDDEDYVFENNGFLGPMPSTRRAADAQNIIIKTEPELIIGPDNDDIDEADPFTGSVIKGPHSPVFMEPKDEPRDDFLDFAYPELEN
ncbi:Transcription factor E4F1 [Orchesella cincta]|uniref:Transcription factor E4F1 n=1 Tax=Orchesella cincta TaxID=48709 RepID=A0A1D2MU95_ORCCI|nr:Transcription factor E4F1 [Orchesella cincta]